MKNSIRLLGLLAAVIAAVFAAAAPAQAASSDQASQAVFVQTNDAERNAIAAFNLNADGTLTFLASYPTRGKGGRQAGSGSDPLASQGSLVRVPEASLLLAVNAGSDTVSVFHIDGNRLELEQVLPSGGQFPTSFAVQGNLVYVLNAGGDGAVSGYQISNGQLAPIAGSTRTLGLANDNPPFFLNSPAEVGFTPDGQHLIVTTKTHGTVDVFSVETNGQLSTAPVKNPAANLPFAFVFDAESHLVLNFAANSSLETFTVNANNTITPVSGPVSDGQKALCWVTPARGFEYTSNTASSTVSQFRINDDGGVRLVNGQAAGNIPGAIDSASADGLYLYVQGGLDGSIHVFSISSAGTLTHIQVVPVPDGHDQEGIAVA